MKIPCSLPPIVCILLSLSVTYDALQDASAPVPELEVTPVVEKEPLPLHSVLDSVFEYTAEQATYLEAKDALVTPTDDGVLVQVLELKPEAKRGIALTVSGITNPVIEVTRLIDYNGFTVGLWPPTDMEPNNLGIYNILGNAGDRFGIRAETQGGLRKFEVKIDGDPSDPPPIDPVDPPPGDGPSAEDLSAITAITSSAVATLNDPITTRYIKSALENVSLSEVLSEATAQAQKAIATALQDSMKEVNPPYKDWNGAFRKPINAKIVELESQGKVKTSAQLKLLVDAIVEGLDSTSSMSTHTIKMYSRPDCILCKNWRRDVFPSLASKGWALEEILLEQGDVPRFVVCDRDKCSNEFVGYMSIAAFANIVTQMRDQ